MAGFDFPQFGRALADARRARGLTVRDVEQLTGLSLGQIARIEQGIPVGLRSVLAVCELLDCAVDEFVAPRAAQPSPPPPEDCSIEA